MESYLGSNHYDLATPDGIITNINSVNESVSEAIVFIENISPSFVGYEIDPEHVFLTAKVRWLKLELIL